MNNSNDWRRWFSPQVLWLHALVVAAVGVCVFMGLWQAGVYEDRQQDDRAARLERPAVPLDSVLTADQPLMKDALEQPVEVTGEYAPAEDQFWVENKTSEGKSGYWLAAPLMIDDSALIVVRGWSPDVVDWPAVPDGEQTFTVHLQVGEQSTTGLDERRVAGSIRIPLLVNELNVDLYSAFALNSDPEQAGGLILPETTEPAPSWSAGLRNLMYSFQWWAFAAFAVFMWWRLSRDVITNQIEKEHAAEAAKESGI